MSSSILFILDDYANRHSQWMEVEIDNIQEICLLDNERYRKNQLCVVTKDGKYLFVNRGIKFKQGGGL